MRLGIDFGTSYCVPATVYGGNSQTLLSKGHYGIPSVFYYDSWEDVLVGEPAVEAGQGSSAKNMKREVKMDLFSTFSVDGKEFTAKQIVGYILKEVQNCAMEEANLRLIDNSIEGVVMAVPVAFTHNEKDIIWQAASESLEHDGKSIPVLGFIKEPVAAALSYFERSIEDHTRILVYDLGGGTCDVALVESDHSLKEQYKVIDSDMIRVGGKDWDEHLIPYIANEIEKIKGINIYNNPAYMEKVKRAAIACKEALSVKQNGKNINRVKSVIEINGDSVSIPVTREMFDEMTIELFQKTLRMTKNLMERNNGEISKIICVGGGSRMPQIQEGLCRAFPSYDIRCFEPENAVAIGAAIYAEMMGIDTTNLQDTAQYSYGIRICRNYDLNPNDEIIHNLILKGDILPVSVKHVFRTTEDNQKIAAIELFENDTSEIEYEYKTELLPILCIELLLPKKCPKKSEINVKITLNKDGLLEVQADEQSGSCCYKVRNLCD